MVYAILTYHDLVKTIRAYTCGGSTSDVSQNTEYLRLERLSASIQLPSYKIKRY